jgi:hypothetical protein
MRIRVRHSYDFGSARGVVGDDLVKARAWDAARSLPGPFALPRNRSEWERAAALPDLDARASDIAAVARQMHAARLCSHGVGTALLELNLARQLPEVRLVCTDYAPQTVERLSAIFIEADVVLRDLRDSDQPEADLHLMHRLDAELGDDEWHDVFARLPKTILFVPNVVLDVAGAAREVARRVLRRGRLTNAGWFRNEAALRSLWSATHTDERRLIGEATAYLLEPRRR